ncbi:MAG: ATP-dependent protease ATPase subunit HslU [Thermaerobacter sp.]|nr:ATP-dependent protease ATPase subunit HslU [Thermaerobacter sp.]
MAINEAALTPEAIVTELDRFIVGQNAAKRAVASALRHRWRRSQLATDWQEDVYPKNILMIGPTGVGKTEIARRLARMVQAPFIKVEATKFTEVGYVGRDVDAMIRDLVEVSVRMVREERRRAVRDRAERAAEERIVAALAPRPRRAAPTKAPWEALFGGPSSPSGGDVEEDDPPPDPVESSDALQRRRTLRAAVRARTMEDSVVEVEVKDEPSVPAFMGVGGQDSMQMNLGEMLSGLMPHRTKRRRMTVAAAREVLTEEEAEKLIDPESAQAEAVERAEQHGIVFIDELDKVAQSQRGYGTDVSREGVQRDILPIVEGSTVVTKYGPVKTDHMLFVAAGAFHVAKPSDLMPELQGRFPIRVELDALSETDFVRILTEPRHALVDQYIELLATEGVTLVFEPDAVAAMARYAAQVNRDVENIGARRLATIMERVLEDVSYHAPSLSGQTVTVTVAYVDQRLKTISEGHDTSRYIL